MLHLNSKKLLRELIVDVGDNCCPILEMRQLRSVSIRTNLPELQKLPGAEPWPGGSSLEPGIRAPTARLLSSPAAGVASRSRGLGLAISFPQ